MTLLKLGLWLLVFLMAFAAVGLVYYIIRLIARFWAT